MAKDSNGQISMPAARFWISMVFVVVSLVGSITGSAVWLNNRLNTIDTGVMQIRQEVKAIGSTAWTRHEHQVFALQLKSDNPTLVMSKARREERSP